jgi:pilus assembly protein CpaE
MELKWVVVGSCREGWQQALQEVGVRVVAETDAAAALDVARQEGAVGVLIDDAAAGRDPLLAASGLVRAGLAVVLAGGRPDQEAIRRAMILGVRDYVDEPFTPSDLARAVAAASGAGPGSYAPAPVQAPAGRLVAVCGARGGSGRSCIALNLAVAFGMAGARPACALDLCLEFGALATLGGVEVDRSLADACRPTGPLPADVLFELTTPLPKLPVRLLASPRDPSLAAEIASEAARPGGRHYVAEILAGLLCRFPWVVADLPPAPGEGWLMALDQAAAVVVVTTPDVIGLAATARLLRLLDALGVSAERRRVVMNAAWGPSRITPAAAGDVIGAAVDFDIPFDPAVGPGADEGRPLLGRRYRGPFARAVGNLAQQIATSALPVVRVG